jgi:hypothetical protein
MLLLQSISHRSLSSAHARAIETELPLSVLRHQTPSVCLRVFTQDLEPISYDETL